MRASHLLPLAAIAAVLSVSTSPAQLRITEVMAASGAANNTPDWFEVTNYGSVTISMDSTWRIDDGSASAGASVPFGGTINIAPGETVVFLEATAGSAALTNFITLWGITGQVGTYTGSQVSLSSGGDGVNLFLNGSPVPGVSFGASTTGRSFYWTYSSSEGTPISGPTGGALSQAGSFGAYTVGSDTASPGVALPLTSPTTKNWTGGAGIWSASGGTNWDGEAWDSTKSAVFAVNSGTVTVNDSVTSLGMDFRVDDYVLSGAGSVEAPQISVVNASDVARIDVVLTGTGGLGKFGLGTLELGAENTYTGDTSVTQGTLRVTADNAITDASVVSVGLGATFDLNDHTDTVGGLAGLGTVDLGSGNLTVSLAGSGNAEFNGGIHGTGDFIVDSAGSGDQIFDTRAATADALKDYTGCTIIRNGTLRVAETGIPSATSEVLIEGGKLRLSTAGTEYTFGANSDVVVTLAGGAIRQDDGEIVTLKNKLNVIADSTIESRVDTGDPLSAPEVRLSGSISGTAGLSVTGGGRVSIETGGSYSGTISVAASNLHVTGVLNAGSVLLDEDSKLSGYGTLAAVSGAGQVSPGSSPGIQTIGVVDPSGGLDFAFEFTSATPNYGDASFSNNDVLRITGANPLEGGLSGINTVEIFLSFASIDEGSSFLGGFFVDQGGNFDSLVAGGDFRFYVLGDGMGTDATLDGFGYYLLSSFNPALGIEVSTVAQAADFGTGIVNGHVMELTVVPEPGTIGLALCGGLALLLFRRKGTNS